MHHWTVHEKVDFPKFSTRYPARGGIFHNFFTTFDPEHRNEKIYIDIFYGVSCNIKHITAISNLYFQ